MKITTLRVLKFGYILRKNVPKQDKTGRIKIEGLCTGNRTFLTIEEQCYGVWTAIIFNIKYNSYFPSLASE